MPYTISFVVRKRQQIDGLSELPREKQPPDLMIWDGNPEDLEAWLEKVLKGKTEKVTSLVIKEDEVE